MVTGIMSESDRRMDAINRGLLRAVAVIAAVVSVIAAWSLVVNSVRILAAARVTVADMPLADDSAPGIARDWTAITEAHYDSMTIVASGLSSPRAGGWSLNTWAPPCRPSASRCWCSGSASGWSGGVRSCAR